MSKNRDRKSQDTKKFKQYRRIARPAMVCRFLIVLYLKVDNLASHVLSMSMKHPNPDIEIVIASVA